MSLPVPDRDAQAASDALIQLISDDIARAGGAISFARFMELALYAPRLGYYTGGSAKLGTAGDFTTAPELTPLFGATLAHVAASFMDQSASHLMEFGAGTGKLALDILTEAARSGIVVESYTIVELSGELRARQQALLADFPQVRWLEGLPERFEGVVLGNEVLDAMPVQLVRRTEQGWRELVVERGPQGFAFAERAPDAALAARIATQIPAAGDLPPDYTTEVHAVGTGFMASLAQMLKAGRGAALLFDYGFPAHEYYVPPRIGGTLMCHYRHHAHPDPFYLPGLQDITAHVDFTAMALAAQDAGIEVLGYMSQAAFLIAAGIGELLLRTDPEDARQYLPQSNAVQKLVSPAEMGELFKVLIVGHGVALPDPLARADRSHRL
ncbi:class I SAM-dependent methyltransferase [Massilia arenosa]|uniref:Class I SAM-dependent methyltransferase n=1 Tax=Zemynaea arenosa TaxID=2561931 RepID=A0A4Y9SHP9_9BURK|nr:SAM-dependent methyltransferase [Massilia arenosa]TFW19970.1 class I SAM-dependent methyltransferase [Massilia arenosa]